LEIIIAILIFYLLVVYYFFVMQEEIIFKNYLVKEYKCSKCKKINYNGFEGAVKGEGEVILYFGGNSNNSIEFIDKINLQNYKLITFNYPGYSNSKGFPSEENFYKMALEVAKKYKPNIVIGRSLGSAVAAYIANKIDVEKLILITPFDSLINVAKHKYPFLPVKMLLRHKFNEIEYLKKSKAKKFLILATNEKTIPKKSIENLKQEINFNKIFFLNSTHADILTNEKLLETLKSCLKDDNERIYGL